MDMIKNFHDVKEKIRAKWNKLTEADIKESKGNVGDIQSRLKKAYGYDDKKAQREFDDFKEKNKIEIEISDTLFHPENPIVTLGSPIMPRNSKDIIQ
jgi:uncharacterized protein YjbJ (UPF0337 family)